MSLVINDPTYLDGTPVPNFTTPRRPDGSPVPILQTNVGKFEPLVAPTMNFGNDEAPDDAPNAPLIAPTINFDDRRSSKQHSNPAEPKLVARGNRSNDSEPLLVPEMTF